MGPPALFEVKTISYPFGDQLGETSKAREKVNRVGFSPPSETLNISVFPLFCSQDGVGIFFGVCVGGRDMIKNIEPQLFNALRSHHT